MTVTITLEMLKKAGCNEAAVVAFWNEYGDEITFTSEQEFVDWFVEHAAGFSFLREAEKLLNITAWAEYKEAKDFATGREKLVAGNAAANAKHLEAVAPVIAKFYWAQEASAA